jgi:Ca-activated chloride channel family protein
MKKASIIILLLLACTGAFAQEKALVKKGNQLYQQKKFKEASASYQQALQQNPAYAPGSFNLGNALIQQQQYDAARKVMTNAAKNSKDKQQQADANYNIGNTYMSEQKWAEAVEAYKQTLRKNPQDVDAKYNLSYALAKMKQDQNGDGKDKNKDDKNKDKDKKDQDKKDQNKDGQDDKKDQDKNGDQNKPQDGKDKEDKEEQKRPEPQPSKLTQQQAENLLNALQQDERKLQDKVQKGKGIPVKTDKDW